MRMEFHFYYAFMQIKSARIPFLFLWYTPGILPEKIGEFLSDKRGTLRYSLRIPFSILWQQWDYFHFLLNQI
jgi:hypothetical protein